MVIKVQFHLFNKEPEVVKKYLAAGHFKIFYISNEYHMKEISIKSKINKTERAVQS